MSLNSHQSPGFGHLPSYDAPGIPWVTSSTVTGIQQYEFPYVTRTITVKNVSGANNIRIAFTQNGIASGNYIDMVPGEALEEEFRITRLYVSSSGNTVAVMAGLTAILQGFAPALTGSNGFQGVG